MTKHRLNASLCSLFHQLDKSHLIYKFSKGGGYKEAQTIGDYKVEYDDEGSSLTVYIWDPDRPCMVMFLEKDTKDVSLSELFYSPKCTIKGDMTRGEGTRGMMTFAIELLKTQGAKTFSLSDKSSIICGNGKKVNLGQMYFLKNGVTWYEKYFDFKPSGDDAVRYERVKSKRLELLDTAFLKAQPCEYFTKDVIEELFAKIGFTFFTDITWVKQL